MYGGGIKRVYPPDKKGPRGPKPKPKPRKKRRSRSVYRAAASDHRAKLAAADAAAGKPPKPKPKPKPPSKPQAGRRPGRPKGSGRSQSRNPAGPADLTPEALSLRKPITRVARSTAKHALSIRQHRHGGPSTRGASLLLKGIWGALPAAQWERVLEAQPLDSAGGRMLTILHTQGKRKISIERACSEAGLKLPDLVRMASEHGLGAAIIDSIRHIPAVVEGLANASKPLIAVCDLCFDQPQPRKTSQPSTIEVPHPRPQTEGDKLTIPCPQCGGAGSVRREPDARAREAFIKLHGGLQEIAGPVVAVNTQFNFGGVHTASVQRGQQLLAAGRQAGQTGQTGQTVRTEPVNSQTTIVDAETVP